jgi:hypothetical protein
MRYRAFHKLVCVLSDADLGMREVEILFDRSVAVSPRLCSSTVVSAKWPTLFVAERVVSTMEAQLKLSAFSAHVLPGQSPFFPSSQTFD